MDVYIDLFILENTLLNLFVIWLTKRIIGKSIPFSRQFFGALLGTCIAVGILMFQVDLIQNAFVKILISGLLVFLVYFPKNLDEFIKIFSCFCFCAMMVAGTMFFLLNGMGGNMVLSNGGEARSEGFSFLILILTLILSWAFIYNLNRLKKELAFKKSCLVTLTIFINEKSVVLPALLDSGNLLREPITRFPVVITELDALKQLLPKEIASFFEQNSPYNIASIPQINGAGFWSKKMRIIPFCSVGTEQDFLWGIRPDFIEIASNITRTNSPNVQAASSNNNKVHTQRNPYISDVIIGVYKKKLSNNREFQALLSPQLMTG